MTDKFEEQLSDLIRVATGASKAKANHAASVIVDVFNFHQETVAGAATWGSSTIYKNRPSAVRWVSDWK